MTGDGAAYIRVFKYIFIVMIHTAHITGSATYGVDFNVKTSRSRKS
jgi:hypothetical protein